MILCSCHSLVNKNSKIKKKIETNIMFYQFNVNPNDSKISCVSRFDQRVAATVNRKHSRDMTKYVQHLCMEIIHTNNHILPV